LSIEILVNPILGYIYSLLSDNNLKIKKTQHFKCYLSKPIANKEDPHWCCATGLPMGVGDHGLAELFW